MNFNFFFKRKNLNIILINMWIVGINVPDNKWILISLQKIYGIGYYTSKQLLKKANIEENKITKTLSDLELYKLRLLIEQNCWIEGQLRQKIYDNIKNLKNIGCYRGLRHRRNLPVRGQRTRTNARTRKYYNILK